MKWRVGQSAKTPPFHGGMTGSTPVRATKRELSRSKSKFPFFFSYDPKFVLDKLCFLDNIAGIGGLYN